MSFPVAHDFAYAKSSVLDFCEKKGRNGCFGCGNKRRFIPDALRFVIMQPHHNLNHIVSDYDENNNAKVVTHSLSAEGKHTINRRNHNRIHNHNLHRKTGYFQYHSYHIDLQKLRNFREEVV